MNVKEATSKYLEQAASLAKKLGTYHDALLRFQPEMREACPQAFNLVRFFWLQWEDKYSEVLALLCDEDGDVRTLGLNDFFDFVTEATRLSTRAHQIHAALYEMHKQYSEFLDTDPSGEDWIRLEGEQAERLGNPIGKTELVYTFHVQGDQARLALRDTGNAFNALNATSVDHIDATKESLDNLAKQQAKELAELKDRLANLSQPDVPTVSVRQLAEALRIPKKRLLWHITQLRNEKAQRGEPFEIHTAENNRLIFTPRQRQDIEDRVRRAEVRKTKA